MIADEIIDYFGQGHRITTGVGNGGWPVKMLPQNLQRSILDGPQSEPVLDHLVATIHFGDLAPKLTLSQHIDPLEIDQQHARAGLEHLVQVLNEGLLLASVHVLLSVVRYSFTLGSAV